MKKVFSIVAVSVATLMLSVGCSSSSSSHELEMSAQRGGDKTICRSAIYVGTQSNDEIMGAIVKAGKENGWRMTPFKSNAVIAEKGLNGDMISTTIKFEKEHISCGMDNVDRDELDNLREAIVEQLKKSNLAH